MIRRIVFGAFCAIVLTLCASPLRAQSWTGAYLGGAIGGGFQRDDASETVRFDTNLDATFTDTVRTASGADAFSPGFCGGLAINAMAAAGCSDDPNGVDFGGRAGYDWQVNRLVFGGLVDVSKTDVTDSVTAFSTTPAFYSFTREINYIAGFRGRIGVGSACMLVYGTGGPAWGRVEQTFTTSNAVNTFVPPAAAAGASSRNVWGYQAGGGIDVRLGARWSLTGEYLFTSLDNRDESTVRAQGPAPATNPFILVNAAGTDLQRTGTFDFHAVRAGLGVRF